MRKPWLTGMWPIYHNSILVYGIKKRATSARLAGQGKKTPIKRRKMKVHNAQELIIDEITELVV